jgi:hypothetical protein
MSLALETAPVIYTVAADTAKRPSLVVATRGSAGCSKDCRRRIRGDAAALDAAPCLQRQRDILRK